MSTPLEDYAMIGDLETAALVGKDGSIDWLCLPRFDSPACFARLLGTSENGRWLIKPVNPVTATRREYKPGTLVLETRYETETGVALVTDFMPIREEHPSIVRIVTGLEGSVDMQMELVMRFDYGSIVPWVRNLDGVLHAVAGPDSIELETPLDVRGQGMRSVAEFTITEGQSVPFVLTWYPSHVQPTRSDRTADELQAETEDSWREWSSTCKFFGPHRDAAVSSLIVLKALTYAPTSGLLAAATTSLPERIGGSRNWDYRFCWLRDATFSLHSFLVGGYEQEAKDWMRWLLRAVAGAPGDIQTVYGIAGERRLQEFEIDTLPGYEGSRPVRVGNAAHSQLQLDVYGELMDLLHLARETGIQLDSDAWDFQRLLLDHLESVWDQPDNGIWEIRSERKHHTHSKVMAWVAFDRAVKSVEDFGMEGPADHWRTLRDRIHNEICEKAYDTERQCFVGYYGGTALDSSVLVMPLVGFLPPDDPRMVSTVEAVRGDLMRDGFLLRYETGDTADGLEGSEGAFLLCTLWLASNLAMQGNSDEAEELFQSVLKVRNDVGLLSEEFDSEQNRLLGNFPQALSHVGIVNTAHTLSTGLPRLR